MGSERLAASGVFDGFRSSLYHVMWGADSEAPLHNARLNPNRSLDVLYAMAFVIREVMYSCKDVLGSSIGVLVKEFFTDRKGSGWRF